MAGELTKMLTGLVLIALVVVGSTLFLGGFANSYPATAQNISEDNFSYFNKASAINGNMSAIAESLQSQESQQVGILETSYNIIAGAFNVIMQLFSVGDLLITLVGGYGILSSSIGIELSWAIGIIFTLILTIVTIAILKAVLKWEV